MSPAVIKLAWQTILYDANGFACNVPRDEPLFLKQPDGHVIVAAYECVKDAEPQSYYAFNQIYDTPFMRDNGKWLYESEHDDHHKPIAFLSFPTPEGVYGLP